MFYFPQYNTEAVVLLLPLYGYVTSHGIMVLNGA